MKKSLAKKILTTTILAAAFTFGSTAILGGNQAMAQVRQDNTKTVTNQLYKSDAIELVRGDAEFNQLLTDFIYTDVNDQVNMPLAQKELLTIVALTANNTPRDIALHTQGALNAGATPEQIRESIMHCTPYVGVSRVQVALEEMYKAFKAAKVKITENTATVNDDTRYNDGLATQKGIFGEAIDKMNASAPADQKHINTNLSANCFGDYYTRKVLDLKERELVTFTALVSLGCVDPQVKAHVHGNLLVGNTRQDLLNAVTVALPYNGYPKTLNAIAAINSIVPAE